MRLIMRISTIDGERERVVRWFAEHGSDYPGEFIPVEGGDNLIGILYHENVSLLTQMSLGLRQKVSDGEIPGLLSIENYIEQPPEKL